MWKRDEVVSPAAPPQPAAPPTMPAPMPQPAPQPAPVVQPMSMDAPIAAPRPAPPAERGAVNIGKSVFIKGELNGSEDLIIEGQVDGKIELRDNVLTIGPNGKIKAQIFAKAVIVQGEVTGNITATERCDIRGNGSVVGDIASPRVAIAEGAHFRGGIDMQKVTSSRAADPKSAAPAAPPPPPGVPTAKI